MILMLTVWALSKLDKSERISDREYLLAIFIWNMLLLILYDKIIGKLTIIPFLFDAMICRERKFSV
jgi:hypothetical protein